METVIILETVFKRGEISECATASKITVDGIIKTPMFLILSVSVIQSFYVFQLIMTIGSCQEPLPIMGLLAALLEEE